MIAFGQSKTIVGLDVGSYAVKAVALVTNKDRLTLQGFAQARIEHQDPGEVIRKVISQLGVRTKRVVTSVSGRSVIVRQIETPNLQGEDLRRHITAEADKFIPFGSDEVIIDAQPLPPRPGAPATSTIQVMLVAVRKTFVLEHLAQLKAAGLTPEVIDVDVFALANAFEVLGPPAPAETEKKATALIDIGASKSNIAIVLGSRVLFTREVYLAGNEISDAIARTLNEPVEEVDRIKLAPGETLEAIIDAAMPAFEDLANEIRLSFDYVEGQFETEVSAVVLSGGSSQLPSIADILGNILGRPVHVFDPLAGLDLVPSKYDIHGLDANSPGLAVALGLAVHQLGFGKAGLGGAQSQAWQPRQHRGAEPVPPVLPAGLGDRSAATQATMPPELAASTMATIPPGMDLAQTEELEVPVEAGINLAPPPIPAPSLTPPPSPIPVGTLLTPPPGTLTPPGAVPAAETLEDAPVAPSTSTILHEEGQRSGLLVVLDDDQEIPPQIQSDRIEKRPARTSTVLKLDDFDDDEMKKSDPKLPELPKL